MGIKSSAQVDLIDLTDGYSVHLTNDNYTFLGTTNSVSGTQSTTCQIMALCGGEQVACSIGTISTPTGISAVSDGKTPMPTITITATSALKTSGSFEIPVIIGDITINKMFSFAIAFKGGNGTSITITKTETTYQAGTSNTTAPTGSWVANPPAVPVGQYLWSKTEVTYSDGKKTTAYGVTRNPENGNNGTSVTVASTSVTYQVSDSGTATPTGNWQTSVPSVGTGKYLWTKTEVTYSDGKKTTSYSVSRNGLNGSDAINTEITSSNGTIFKNTAIATTMTAHVYKGGVEVTGSALTALGTLKWYKDGGTTAIATGTTLTVSAGDVSNKATYKVNLED
jgi:hypothetical protein|nr:MAG TPA: tail protein [Caudoviricetes sp.]